MDYNYFLDWCLSQLTSTAGVHRVGKPVYVTTIDLPDLVDIDLADSDLPDLVDIDLAGPQILSGNHRIHSLIALHQHIAVDHHGTVQQHCIYGSKRS
jgi:hypothetical protein